jgi:glutamate carboxypeptidase
MNNFKIKLSKAFITLAISMFTTISIAESNPSTIANQISSYTKAHQQEQLDLLEKLVNINSGTTNLSGIYQTGKILQSEFEALGFNVYWMEEPSKLKRAGTLIAEHAGASKNRLLLIGHLDTVFPANSNFLKFRRNGTYASGPGIIDDKGGDVVILYALKALRAADALKESSITVILTGDEEDAGEPISISRKPLVDVARRSNIALDFECALSLDTATIARRGISRWIITTEGKEAHSSEIFHKGGFGAAYELSRILDAIRMQFANERDFSFNPGFILGGTALNLDISGSQGSAFGKENVVAQSAMAKGDLRFLTESQKHEAEREISAIVEAHLPGTAATITFQDRIPAMPPTKANLELLEQYSKASQKLGYGKVQPLDPGLRGAGDISHIASMVSSSLAGLGPVGTGAHSIQETLDINSLSIQTERAALLIYWLTHTDQQ